jgi:PAS domain S-box-containing protein
LLNIEDTHRNAFSEDEKKAIEGILKEVSSFLNHSWTHHFLSVALQSASDAIFVTNVKGIVKQVNQAGFKLLGLSERSIVGKSLANCLKDKVAAENFINAGIVPNHEVAMVGKNRREIPVLLSGCQLQKEFSSSIFVAKDVSLQKKLEELEYLEKIFIEIATQIKTPLSLLYSWLNQLKQEDVADSYDDILDKAVRQLRKLELTYDRMAFYVLHEDWKKKNGYHPFLLNFTEVLDNIKSDLPQTDIDKILWELDKPRRYLNGDLFQLVFCFKAVLSYLLRFAPIGKQTVKFKLSEKNRELVVEMSGRYPGRAMKRPEDKGDRRTLSRTLAEMALGEKTIRTIIKNHRGKYHNPKLSAHSATFRIDLPLSQEV